MNFIEKDVRNLSDEELENICQESLRNMPKEGIRPEKPSNQMNAEEIQSYCETLPGYAVYREQGRRHRQKLADETGMTYDEYMLDCHNKIKEIWSKS
jgi:hypothetical protein